MFLYVVFEFLINKKISHYIGLIVNTAFCYLLFKMAGIQEVVSSREVFLTITLCGSSYFTFFTNKKNPHLLNIQVLLSILLLKYDNILFNSFGLLVLSSLIGERSIYKSSKLVEGLFFLTLLILCFLQIGWGQGLDITSLSLSLKNNVVLSGLIVFLIFYGPIRLYFSANDHDNKSLANEWLWIGVYLNYFLFLTHKLNLTQSLSSSSLTLVSYIVLTLAILFIVKIENLKSRKKLLMLMYSSNQLLIIYLLFMNNMTFGLLYMINFIAITLLVIFSRANFWIDQDSKTLFPAVISIILLAAFLIGPPYTPWFDIRLELFNYLSKSSKLIPLTVFIILLGIRLRQNLLFIINISRVKLSKKPKPS